MVQMQELVPYLKDSNHHDFGHYVNRLRFVSDMEELYDTAMLGREAKTRASLGLKDPLTGTKAHTEECEFAQRTMLTHSRLHVSMWVTPWSH